jgi:hypothetical protein
MLAGLDVPLHQLIELRPRPDGTMEIERIPIMHPTPSKAPNPNSKPEPCNVGGSPSDSLGGDLDPAEEAAMGNSPREIAAHFAKRRVTVS